MHERDARRSASSVGPRIAGMPAASARAGR